MKCYSWKTESTRLSENAVFFPNLHQNIVLEPRHYVNHSPRSWNEPTNLIGKYLTTSPKTRRTKVFKKVRFLNSHQKVQFFLLYKLGETLTLVSRYFKSKVFVKMTSPTHFRAKLVLVLLTQLKIWIKNFDKSNTTSEKELNV